MTRRRSCPRRESSDRGQAQAQRVVSALDPSFRAQELSFVVTQIATNSDLAAAAERRSWVERLLGRQPEGLPGRVSAVQARAGSRAERHSLWLHNSVRAAVALALAVLVADLSSVQHGFWVVFATLSVLRSNALSTGQSTVRALLGTASGFVVGGIIVYLIGTNTALLWVLLPVAVLFAGLAPAAVSFAAGQAGFTLTLLILFNILAPAGWRIGLVRVEDIALGCAVSLVVGLLFWPRGAGAALGRALADAYQESSRYLARAVAYGAGLGDRDRPRPAPPYDEAAGAAAAARRLDDTFRGYLSERGSKPIPMAEVTSLITGVVGVRLAADAVLDLWDGDGAPEGDRSAARRELLSAAEYMTSWYAHFAASLNLREPVPEPLAPDRVADGRLIDAVSEDLQSAGRSRDGDRSADDLDRRSPRCRASAAVRAGRARAGCGRRGEPEPGRRPPALGAPPSARLDAAALAARRTTRGKERSHPPRRPAGGPLSRPSALPGVYV